MKVATSSPASEGLSAVQLAPEVALAELLDRAHATAERLDKIEERREQRRFDSSWLRRALSVDGTEDCIRCLVAQLLEGDDAELLRRYAARPALYRALRRARGAARDGPDRWFEIVLALPAFLSPAEEAALAEARRVAARDVPTEVATANLLALTKDAPIDLGKAKAECCGGDERLARTAWKALVRDCKRRKAALTKDGAEHVVFKRSEVKYMVDLIRAKRRAPRK